MHQQQGPQWKQELSLFFVFILGVGEHVMLFIYLFIYFILLHYFYVVISKV